MTKFDIDASLRWIRSFPTKSLARRPDTQLPFVDNAEIGGQPLLLDTCVYIDRMQGQSTDRVKELMATRLNNHSSVAIQELAHTIGVLDPADPRTPNVVRVIKEVISSMPGHRILTPDVDILGRAAVLNGIICRIQGYTNSQRLRCLQDCTLYLLALKYGLIVSTKNISDYDFCNQLVPSGRVLFYRN